MKSNLYIDKRSIMQVLGCLMTNPNLFDRTDKYHLDEIDFREDFYILIFGVIKNLKLQGLKKIEILDIDNYLSTRPGANKLFQDNKGIEYISEIVKIADQEKFNYYYQRIKKMTLLRGYMDFGVDISFLYNPNSLDIKLKQQQEDWLDACDIIDIITAVDNKINEVKSEYYNSTGEGQVQAGQNIFELISNLKKTPEVGIPLFGPIINTITRGARLKKFYLRSAPSGVGKSRMAVADVCNFSCNEIFDLYTQTWIRNGTSEPTLYITTEQEIDEIQTMMLAFLSAVDEEHILNGKYDEGEEERVLYAAKLISNAPMWIEEMPNFSLQDIENIMRKHILDNGVKYIALDYIHTSLKIMEEITKKVGGIRLREDQILYMLVIRLKDLCNELGVFLTSSTQLNGEWEGKRDANQNLLRGAKAMADKIDFGSIVLPVTEDDVKCLETILATGAVIEPNLVYHIYKNRRSKHKSVKLWCSANLGTCRVTPIFLTDNGYKLIPIEDFNIIVEEDDEENKTTITF